MTTLNPQGKAAQNLRREAVWVVAEGGDQLRNDWLIYVQCCLRQSPDIVELIEQVGQLQDDAEATTRRIKALQAHVKPYAEKVRRLAALVSKYAATSGLDPDLEFTETTDDFILQVGKAGTLRTVVDAERAMKRMGKKLFFEKCTIGLGVLDAYLTPAEKQGILKVERCERGIRVLRRAQGKRDA